MNVLYLTYDGLTDALGQSQVLPYIRACNGPELNFSIISFEKEGADAKAVDLLQRTLKSEGIRWIPKKYHKRPALLSSLLDVYAMILETRKAMTKEKIDVIHCRSYVSAFAAFYLKDRTGVRVIFDMRGFWADERMEGGIWNKSNPIHNRLYNYLKKKEKYWFEKADQLVSLTNNGRDILIEMLPTIKTDKISVIPCCGDENLFAIPDEEERSEVRESLGIGKNEKVLLYVGSIGTWYLAPDMMRLFARAKSLGVFQKFLWISNSPEEIIFESAMKEGLERDDLIVISLPRDQVAAHIGAADAGVFFIKPSFSKRASSPTKLAEMLLCGLPVISNKGVGDLDSFFSANRIGICMELEDMHELSKDDLEELLSMRGEAIRQVGLKSLSLSLGQRSYRRLYKNLEA